MKLNEIDRSEEIKEAGKIVQEMYNKLNKPLIWADGSKPSVRSLVKKLDDSYLTKISEDLDSFLKFGKEWLKKN